MKTTCTVAICFILFLAGTTSVFGQTKNTPSKVVAKEGPQKLLADSLYKLASKYDKAGDNKQAVVFFEKSLTIYQKIGENKGIGDCLNRIGAIWYYQGNFTKALYFFEKSVVAYKSAGNKKGIGLALTSVGAVHQSLGNYPRALEFYKQAVGIQNELGDEGTIAALTQNIGSIYFVLKDYPNAMKYHSKAYSMSKKLKDQKTIAQYLNITGFIYVKLGNYEKALESLNQALTIANKEKDDVLKTEALAGLGELFYQKSDFKKALLNANRALQYAKKINNTPYIGDIQITIGNTLHKLKKDREAVENCKSGLKIGEESGSVYMKKEACECLYKSYKSLGNKSLALDYYEKVNVLDDSLQFKETANKIMDMEFQKQQLADSVAFVKKEAIVEQKHQEEIRQKEKQRNFIIASLCVMLLVAAGLWSSLRLVRKSRAALSVEKDRSEALLLRSEALLLNILPPDVAEELKEKGSVTAKDFELVSILFTDFKSFTQTAETMSPQSLVEEINVCFQAFDLISEKYQIEKIKTIGDAYMAAGGMAKADQNALKNTVLAGLEMQTFVKQRAIENQQAQKPAFEMRLGIHAGPIVAGIVGVKKFQYDIWGDTVNTASRMESNGAVGKVNISETLYQILKDDVSFAFEPRGSIEAKGKGEMPMYFVEMKI